MTTVWIVEEDHGYSGTSMRGAFSTEERAEAWIRGQRYAAVRHFTVEERVLDADHQEGE